jgi:hypothetical protein
MNQRAVEFFARVFDYSESSIKLFLSRISSEQKEMLNNCENEKNLSIAMYSIFDKMDKTDIEYVFRLCFDESFQHKGIEFLTIFQKLEIPKQGFYLEENNVIIGRVTSENDRSYMFHKTNLYGEIILPKNRFFDISKKPEIEKKIQEIKSIEFEICTLFDKKLHIESTLTPLT